MLLRCLHVMPCLRFAIGGVVVALLFGCGSAAPDPKVLEVYSLVSIGMSEEDAREHLAAAGFRVEEKYRPTGEDGTFYQMNVLIRYEPSQLDGFRYAATGSGSKSRPREVVVIFLDLDGRVISVE